MMKYLSSSSSSLSYLSSLVLLRFLVTTSGWRGHNYQSYRNYHSCFGYHRHCHMLSECSCVGCDLPRATATNSNDDRSKGLMMNNAHHGFSSIGSIGYHTTIGRSKWSIASNTRKRLFGTQSTNTNSDDAHSDVGNCMGNDKGLYHSPVMLTECCNMLDIQAGETYVDATLGGGGHTIAFLGRGANVIALDQDQDSINYASSRLQSFIATNKLEIIRGNFRNIDQLVHTSKLMPKNGVAGILLDLGVSSYQIDEPSRGFSFGKDGPLDMRMDQSKADSNKILTAADIVNEWNVDDIANVLFQFGEERRSRQIAREIVNVRPITSTMMLVDTINRITPWSHRAQTLARCFQALRICVNDEMGAIDSALACMESIVAPGGRVVVLSYHSLEDRRVKQAFRVSDSAWSPINKKVITATEEEIARNVRARSAKLRAARKNI